MFINVRYVYNLYVNISLADNDLFTWCLLNLHILMLVKYIKSDQLSLLNLYVFLKILIVYKIAELIPQIIIVFIYLFIINNNLNKTLLRKARQMEKQKK